MERFRLDVYALRAQGSSAFTCCEGLGWWWVPGIRSGWGFGKMHRAVGAWLVEKELVERASPCVPLGEEAREVEDWCGGVASEERHDSRDAMGRQQDCRVVHGCQGSRAAGMR